MDGKSKTLAKNVSILTISNFSTKILVFFLVPLYTNFLTTDEYGLYDLAVSTVTLLIPILSLNILDAVMRFLMEQQVNKNQVVCIALKYIIISTVGFTFIVLFIRGLSFGEKISGYELLIILYYIFYLINQFCIQFAKGIERIKEMGMAGVMGTAVMIFLNIYFLCYLKTGLKGFFIANIIAQIIPSLYLVVSLKIWNYLNIKEIDSNLQREMLMYCTPLIASVIGWWANSGSDKYVVTFFCGVAQNGLLSVAYKIPSILNTFQGIFVQAWQISAVKEYGEKETNLFYGHVFSIINFMMCIACSALIILTKPIAYILYAKDFYPAWQFVPFLLISSVFNSASGLLGPILSAKKDSKTMALSATIGALINIFLNVFFVYLFGVQGVTIATVISSVIIYEMRYKAVKKEMYIGNYLTILLTWILLCVQAFIEIYINATWPEFIVIILILVLNNKLLKEIFAVAKNICTSKRA